MESIRKHATGYIKRVIENGWFYLDFFKKKC
jgi:hypothetical protein